MRVAARPDIMALVAYRMEDCAKACLSYDKNQPSTACKGVTFNRDLEGSVALNLGTCFLKSQNRDFYVDETRNDYMAMMLF